MKSKDSQLITGFFVVIFLIVVIRNAWISDDAYISFRAIENLVAGYGFNFNPFVRVQAYTHPLWALLISAIYFVQTRLLDLSRDNGLYMLVIFLSIFVSTLSVYIVFSKTNKIYSKLVFGVAIISSKAFIDYSTSGLENPLTYFLLALFFLIFLSSKENLLGLTISAALITVNRQDAILLVLPALVYHFLSVSKSWKTKIRELVLGFSPLILWELFSIFYYGFPFPNTAYAKLNTGVPKISLIGQGIDYFLNSIALDPVTLLIIAFAGVAVFIEKDKKKIISYIGVLLYLAYILSIGGDFMSGRFFAAPFFIAIILFSRISFFSEKTFLISLAIILLFVAYTDYSPIKNIVARKSIAIKVDLNGIEDEKAVHENFSGLTEYGIRHTAEYGSEYAGKKWIYTEKENVEMFGMLGRPAYEQGPNTYAYDFLALSDPLLARLPAKDKVNWRIGHFWRKIPTGYHETLESGEIEIKEPNLALYYEKLSYVISAPLWDSQRFIEIFKLNTGQYDYLIERYVETPNNEK